jgi:hypothetical protein
MNIFIIQNSNGEGIHALSVEESNRQATSAFGTAGAG